MKRAIFLLTGLAVLSLLVMGTQATTEQGMNNVREDGLDTSLLPESGRSWIAPEEAFEPPQATGDDNLPPPSANATVIITSDDGFGSSRRVNDPSFLNYPNGRYLWCGRQGGGIYLDVTRFKFPLTTLPNGVTITDAKVLAFQILSAGGDSRIDRTQVSPSDDAWVAGTLTYNYILSNPASSPVVQVYVTGLGWREFSSAALATQVQSENTAADDVLSLEFDAPTGSYTYFRDYENREYFLGNETELHVEIQVDWDVSIESIDDPASASFALKDPNVPFNPTITVRNRGAQDFNNAEVTMQITGPAPAPVTEVMNTGFLANTTGETQMAFGSFTPGDEPKMYNVAFTARITDPAGHDPDENPTNNQANVDFYSWADKVAVDCIFITGAMAAPAIDGNVDVAGGEWLNAVSVDISDVHGMAGSAGLTDAGPNPPGSAFIYTMNDDNFMYLGFKTVDPTNTFFDQDGIYFDDDHDHLFRSNGKEGNYWQINDYQQELAFRRIPSYSTTYSPAGAFSSVDLAAGGMNYELALPMGTETDPDWYVDTWETSSNSETIGASIWTWDYANEGYGYFPSRMPGSSWNTPADYGHICVKLPPPQCDIDIDDDYANLDANVMNIYTVEGGKAYAQYMMVNPEPPDPGPDYDDGPGNFKTNATKPFVCASTDLTEWGHPGVSDPIDASRVNADFGGSPLLDQGDVFRNTVEVDLVGYKLKGPGDGGPHIGWASGTVTATMTVRDDSTCSDNFELRVAVVKSPGGKASSVTNNLYGVASGDANVIHSNFTFGQKGYNLYRSDLGGEYTRINDALLTDGVYEDRDIISDLAYQYKVGLVYNNDEMMLGPITLNGLDKPTSFALLQTLPNPDPLCGSLYQPRDPQGL
jgi:hypothetical protein